VKSVAIKVVFVALWLFLFYESLLNINVREFLQVFCTQNPVLAPLVLILVQLVLASFALPCSPLAVLAGVLWGWELGLLYSMLATVIASNWTFFLGRYYLKRWAKESGGAGWWVTISGLIERYKWKASMLAHANPMFPGSSLGYAFGASKISLNAFFFGVILGTFPLQIMIVFLGSAAVNIQGNLSLNLILAFIGVVVIIALYKILIPKLWSVFIEQK
jgi:uncharacterized membrane protein YdjX (TVP38/TMEM64 family)